jgi:putative ABC transport system substrate-binding protein
MKVVNNLSRVLSPWSVVRFCLALCATLLGLSFPAHGQQSKIYRIGVLFPEGPLREIVEGLRGGLRQLGLEEGKQFTLAIRDTKGDAKIAEAEAKNFERDKLHLIYAITIPVTAAAKRSSGNIPIVFVAGSDPVTGGLVASFAKPGGRLTGVQYLVRDITAKRLEVLKEILPKLNGIITFYTPAEPVSADAADLARQEAKRLGLKFVERQVTSAEGLRKVLQELKAGEADAFFYIPGAMVLAQAQLIIDTARAKKLPTMFQEQSLVAKGGLASYGQNYQEIGRLSAQYVQKVLTGTPPKDLRVETVEDVEMVINLKTAKELGLNIPASVLARANKVIK